MISCMSLDSFWRGQFPNTPHFVLFWVVLLAALINKNDNEVPWHQAARLLSLVFVILFFLNIFFFKKKEGIWRFTHQVVVLQLMSAHSYFQHFEVSKKGSVTPWSTHW